MAKIMIISDNLILIEGLTRYLEGESEHKVVILIFGEEVLERCIDLAVVDELDLDCSGRIVAKRLGKLGIPTVGLKTLYSQPRFGNRTIMKGGLGSELLTVIDELLAEAPAGAEK